MPMVTVRRHPFAPSGIKDWNGVEQCARCPLPKPNEIHDLPATSAEQGAYERRKTGER